jgi:hypothetical protein
LQRVKWKRAAGVNRAKSVLSGTTSLMEKGSPINSDEQGPLNPNIETKSIVTKSKYKLDPKDVLVAQIKLQLIPRPQTVMGEINL